MQPKNSIHNQLAQKSFIEQARRRQIVAAAIPVLAQYGFIRTSFVRIGKQAGIAPSLISYHFTDKQELMDEIRACIYEERYTHTTQAVAAAKSWTAKLQSYIASDIEYMQTHPEFFRALVEVLFGQRDKNGMPLYMQDRDTPMLALLHNVLKNGQAAGEFTKFDAYTFAHVIDGAKDQFLAQLSFRPSLDPKEFARTLAEVASCYTRKSS